MGKQLCLFLKAIQGYFWVFIIFFSFENVNDIPDLSDFFIKIVPSNFNVFASNCNHHHLGFNVRQLIGESVKRFQGYLFLFVRELHRVTPYSSSYSKQDSQELQLHTSPDSSRVSSVPISILTSGPWHCGHLGVISVVLMA